MPHIPVIFLVAGLLDTATRLIHESRHVGAAASSVQICSVPICLSIIVYLQLEV